jgi:hypothetical protein
VELRQRTNEEMADMGRRSRKLMAMADVVPAPAKVLPVLHVSFALDLPEIESDLDLETRIWGRRLPDLLQDLSLSLGNSSYAREFYGAGEGTGSGAGSRRYEELEGSYLGGGYDGLGYGQGRTERDFTGSPR